MALSLCFSADKYASVVWTCSARAKKLNIANVKNYYGLLTEHQPKNDT